jgi:hypothetical protein
VGISRRRQEAYDDFVETICELSGACRQSSESFQDLVSLIECDFMPLTPATNPDANTREVLNLKLKMGKILVWRNDILLKCWRLTLSIRLFLHPS